ncbi:MAG TPA: AraC family transcriptional regulator [Candidatus Limiplasma sp.]|nr:AraC family transcriptional regulator [Candidatus Limiplasma sp.]
MHSSFWKSRTFRFWIVCYLIVLLVPMVAGVVLYFDSSDMLTRKAYETGTMSVSQVSNVVDEQLSTVSNVSDTITVSSTLVRLKYLSLPFDAAKYYEIHQRAEYLSNFTVQQALIKYIFVYCSDLECLLDTGHIYTATNQLDKMITQRIGLSTDRFYELMAQNHLHDFYVLGDGDSLILLQTLGARGSEKTPAITLITVLNADAIADMLTTTSETTNGSAYMLLPDGSVFGDYAPGDPIDYAALPSLSGEEQLQHNDLVVTYTDSETSSFRYVLSVPRATFLRDLRKVQLTFFSFLLAALALGLLIAYMLAKHNYRPIQELKQAAQIPEMSNDDFTALGTKLKELLTADNKMHSQIEQLSQAANSQLIHSVLSGNVNTLEPERRAQLHEIFTGTVFIAALIDLGGEDPTTPEARKALTGSLNLLMSECAGGTCQSMIQPDNDAFAAILCFTSDMSHNDAQFLAQQIGDHMIQHAVEQPALASMSIYFGNAYGGIEHVHASYANALRAKEYADFVTVTDKRVILYDATMFSSDIVWEDYDIVDAERQFSSLMIEGNYAKGKKILREIMAYYNCRDGMSLYVMRCRMFGVMNMMINVLHEVEPDLDTTFWEETNPVERLLSARTQQELEDVIFDIIDRLVGRQESKSPDIQEKLTLVEHYIVTHYYDVGLGVKQVADAFDMSLPYLSRMFKKEKGIGLLYYINNYRVEKAKEIMTINPGETVAGIAGRVGYNSSQTLIRIFKRYEGITPGQYQANLHSGRHGTPAEGTPAEGTPAEGINDKL